VREQTLDLRAREHDRKTPRRLRAHEPLQPRQLDSEHLAVEEHQCRERLVLGRGRDALLHRECAQERGHLLGAELGRMAAAVEHDEAPDPADVRLFGATAHVAQARGLAHAVEQARRGSAVHARRLARDRVRRRA